MVVEPQEKRHLLKNHMSSHHLHNHLHYSTKTIVKMIKYGSLGGNALLQFDKNKENDLCFQWLRVYKTCTWLNSHEKSVFFSNTEEKDALRAARWTQLYLCGHQSQGL